MAFELPSLPYSLDSLAPHVSAATLATHHGKHHAGYLNKLNALVDQDAGLSDKTLEELICTTTGPVFINAAQAWNHGLYWSSMSPEGGGEPPAAIEKLLSADFGSAGVFREQFTAAAVGHFGSGWAWLVRKQGKLSVIGTHDADCPIRDGYQPLLVCDVWEHAYYLDYKNERNRYVEAWWNVVNWEFVAENLR